MAQWFGAKAAHPDALLFFRMGDFYELFMEDAERAAAALDIALTARGEHAGKPIAMCGVPVVSAEMYLGRLIRRGFRVAVVEQMEKAPARGRAPIRREVVRLVTPGTLTEEALLEAGRPNLLMALAEAPAARGATPMLGAAWLDISTGAFETAALPTAALAGLLGRLDPAELLAPAGLPLGDHEGRRAPDAAVPPVPEEARQRVAAAFGAASLDAFGSFTDAEAAAASLALAYATASQAGKQPRLAPPVPQGERGVMELDAATRASLEIIRARDGGAAHTLLAAVQRTLTAPGGRLLSARLSAPLTAPAAIAGLQAEWLFLAGEPGAAAGLRAALRGVPDMARALGRLALGRGTPRDLGAIRDGIAAAGRAAAALGGDGLASLPPGLAEARGALALPELAALLNAALAEPLPARLDDGGAIAAGFDAELDAERRLRDESRRVVSGLQLDYAQRYGVASLKLRHHAQLGYVIEVPAAAVETLSAHPDLTLRQGMANGARFGSAELAALSRRIVEAAERAAARERRVFEALAAGVLERADAISAAAASLARLDVAQSAARLAEGGAWCRPTIGEGTSFRIEAGRHPVVEAALTGQTGFVPNDCDLSPERRVLLLTGPNMAGKSTYLRQNALIAILAQAGLPVPAKRAEIGAVDRLFSRVGAADDLARGRSTFMVEMTETAAILRQAGPKSLVVVDEIGRGTATLDGLAIAWAVLEALHDGIGCRTVFATHFHELAGLGLSLPRMRPHMMRVREWKGAVVFLHEVAEGAGGRSWGVHVAKLAGVPNSVVARAGTLLAALERRGPLTDAAELPLFAAAGSATPSPDPELDPLHAALAALDPDRLTPREALDALYFLKARATSADARTGLD